MKYERFFMALCKDRPDVPQYSLYFINNSFEDIDTMVSIKPGVMSEIKPGAMLDDINQEFIEAHEGIEKFRDVRPRTYVTTGFYFDWDFDWSNECCIFLRTRRGEEHIKFCFEKYLVAFADQIVKIPVLKKSGWVSYLIQRYE